jgi:hypothetical protein
MAMGEGRERGYPPRYFEAFMKAFVVIGAFFIAVEITGFLSVILAC